MKKKNQFVLLGSLLALILLVLPFSLAIDSPTTSVVIRGTRATINVTYHENVGLSDMTITLLPRTNIPVDNRPPIQPTFSCGQGRNSFLMSQNLRHTGNYTFYIRVVDCAGNFRTDTRNFSVIIPGPVGCGNGDLNTSISEECDDGNTISGDGCSSFCKRETCGNNRVDYGEICDGSALNGLECSSFPGYVSGSLGCSNRCERFVFSTCTATESKCGNEIIELGEQCDGANFGMMQTCAQLDSAFTGGQLSCNPLTCQFSTSECLGKRNAICGNSQVEVGEQCDSSVKRKCSDFDGFFGNGLICSSANCAYNTSLCEKPATRCGDGEVNTKLNENCDGSTFLSYLSSCSDLSDYDSGSLKCKNDCSLDVFDCVLRQSLNDTCVNGKKNPFETDVDCGGTCGCCETKNTCLVGSDCCSGFCNAGVCQEASCTDGLKNGFESDVDCGGFCENKCAVNLACEKGSDCISGYCSNSVCLEASCTDGVKNGLETDADCGSDCPDTCAVGQVCSYSSDCSSGFCEYGLCTTDKTSDSDFDQMPDFWEDKYGLDKNDATDAPKDFDRDGFTNLEEYFNGTDPTVFNEGGKSGVLALVFLIVGLVLILASSGFLFYYRTQLKEPSYSMRINGARPGQLIGTNPQVVFSQNQRTGMNQPGLAPNSTGKSSSALLRRFVLQKKNATGKTVSPTTASPASNVSASIPKTSEPSSKQQLSNAFEKLKSLSSDSKKKKK